MTPGWVVIIVAVLHSAFIESCEINVKNTASLINEIGNGLCSNVFMATLSNSEVRDKIVALKIIHMEFRKAINNRFVRFHSGEVDNFAKEILALERLKEYSEYPYVLKYYGSYIDNANLYIAMEYCSMDLYDFFYEKRKSFSVERIRLITLDVAKGIQLLNNLNMMHQDIKMENILINIDGNVVIADFDSIYLGNKPGQYDPMECADFYGTLDYVAYEMTAAGKHGPKVDVWSLAVVSYNLATRYHPFRTELMDDMAPKEELRRIIAETVVDYWTVGSMDVDLACFIQSALSLDPNKRPSITECLEKPWFKNANEATLKEERSKLANELTTNTDINRRAKLPYKEHSVPERSSILFNNILIEKGCILQELKIIHQ
jgi:serine/threonine protein kinase